LVLASPRADDIPPLFAEATGALLFVEVLLRAHRSVEHRQGSVREDEVILGVADDDVVTSGVDRAGSDDGAAFFTDVGREGEVLPRYRRPVIAFLVVALPVVPLPVVLPLVLLPVVPAAASLMRGCCRRDSDRHCEGHEWNEKKSYAHEPSPCLCAEFRSCPLRKPT